MILAEDCFKTMIEAPVRTIKARVELLEGSTLLHTFKHTDRLISLTVERVGEGKFFGFGICQKINVKLIDKERELDISTANTIDIAYGSGCDFIYPHPIYKVSQVRRDELTNELSITAYDYLYPAAQLTTSEIDLSSYTIKGYAAAIGIRLGLNCVFRGFKDESTLNLYYENGANFDGTETLRSALDAIAEATQSIYYVNRDLELVFRRLDVEGEPELSITKDKYFSLESKDNRRLAEISHITELGDNIGASIQQSGTKQYIRDNPFLELRDDVAAVLNAAIETFGGMTINQFSCNWRGNYLTEIGDKISLITKDDETAITYLLNDTIEYNGTFTQKSKWEYQAEEEQSINPTTIGDALNLTYARVDKQNKQIELLASDNSSNKETISSLIINTDSISASIQKIGEETNESLNSVNEEINALSNKVSAAMTAEEVSITIQSELANGVEKVITTTGYTLDESGLTIEKTDTEMKTTISEDGMTVYKNDEAVLVANNVGVNATNLHATTYLIIGNNSRFEDYADNRTGCFWIGG